MSSSLLSVVVVQPPSSTQQAWLWAPAAVSTAATVFYPASVIDAGPALSPGAPSLGPGPLPSPLNRRYKPDSGGLAYALSTQAPPVKVGHGTLAARISQYAPIHGNFTGCEAPQRARPCFRPCANDLKAVPDRCCDIQANFCPGI